MMQRKLLDLKYSRIDEIPIEHLVQLASAGEWLDVAVETQAKVLPDGNFEEVCSREKAQLIQRLGQLLPDHLIRSRDFVATQAQISGVLSSPESAIVSGKACIVIWRYTPDDVERITGENLELLLALISIYRSLANRLIRRLALQLGDDVNEFSGIRNWRRHEQTGTLLDDGNGNSWAYYFHGLDCAFGNSELNAKIEARLGHGSVSGDDFGVIEHYFFRQFACSYAVKFPKFMPIARMFNWSKYQTPTNTQIALTYLERRGYLRATSTNQGWGHDWVVVEPDTV